MRRHVTLLFGLVALVGLVTACTVAFDDTPTTPGVFKCETNEDCIGPGQICEENSNGTKVCKEESAAECVDKDKDGFGSNEERATCPACENPQDNGCNPAFQDCCAKDCDDENAAINPGQIEACDNVDNNCDGTVDAPIGQAACALENGSCPIAAEEPQANTGWGCTDKIDGTPQCVLKGSFTVKEKCQQPESFGKCVNGEWTMVDSDCTMN